MSLLPPEFSPWLAAALVAVSFVASLLSAAAGLGGGTVMLAAIATAVPAGAVIPLHGVIQVGSNAGRAWLLRGAINRSVLGYFALGALLGVLAGARLYVALPPAAIKMVLGAFILYSVWAPRIRRMRVARSGLVAVGAVTSFLTMFVGGTGVFVAAFLSPERFGKEPTVATHAACMTLQHGLKVAAFGVLGFAFGPWLALIAAMIGAGFAGTVAGRAILLRLHERLFALVFRGVLTLLALRLLWSATVELMAAA